jgi:dTDP-4-amino-4,6-dideoxygalactose transaminase
LLAAGVGSGDEVITVSHSYIATANSIRYCGATPVFVDISPDQFNIDPDAIEAAITPLTRAILCVHQIGMPCDLGRIVPIAEKHSVPLIEDAACAIGSEILWAVDGNGSASLMEMQLASPFILEKSFPPGMEE